MEKELIELIRLKMEEQNVTIRELAKSAGVNEVRMFRILSGARDPQQMEMDNITMVLKMPRVEVRKMNIGVKSLWLVPLMEGLEPGTFVRVLRFRNEMDSSVDVIFDGEAGEFREQVMKGFGQAAVSGIRLAPDPDTVDSVMEITLARN